MLSTNSSRRNFLRKVGAFSIGATLLGGAFRQASANKRSDPQGLFMIGPLKGYTPQIGTLVSMLNYNRSTIVGMVQSMTMEQLDYLHDARANTIGALIMHLGAVEKFYQVNTFEGREEFNAEEKEIWGAALELGDEGRKQIRGRHVEHYLKLLADVRAKTLEELKKKNDDWLLAVDPKWSKPGRPLNTYWKWFHVCEHESNHRGQIAFLRSRLPGARLTGEG